jgi:hypothetical protein
MIPQFALRLVVGLSLTWCLAPRRLITSGYFRIQMLLALGLSVLGALTASQWTDVAEGGTLLSMEMLQGALVLIAGTSFVGSVLWTLERRRGGTVAAALMLALGTFTLAAGIPRGASTDPPVLLEMLDRLSSAWLLGGMTATMLLGHWYLTATGMSLVPLSRATLTVQIAVVARLVTVLAATLLTPADIRERLLQSQWVWTLLRWGAGLVGPLVLAFLIPGALRYRNTQSATGILFAAVILTFIGEAAALLLLGELGWPL